LIKNHCHYIFFNFTINQLILNDIIAVVDKNKGFI